MATTNVGDVASVSERVEGTCTIANDPSLPVDLVTVKEDSPLCDAEDSVAEDSLIDDSLDTDATENPSLRLETVPLGVLELEASGTRTSVIMVVIVPDTEVETEDVIEAVEVATLDKDVE